MKFKLIVVGKIKEKSLKDLINEYLKRIGGYLTIELNELVDEPIKNNPSDGDIEIAKNKEGEKILKLISPKDHVITFDLNKKEYDSVQFAKLFEKKCDMYNGHLVFVIGGSYGLSDNVKARANDSLSLSKMTFPHQLFRLIVLEQIYRAIKINNNEVYHK